MAIDPQLLNIKPISEITTVDNPIKGHLLFYDGGDELKKVDIVEFQSLVNNVQIGGRNLFLESEAERNAVFPMDYNKLSETLIEGKEYNISFEIKGVNDGRFFLNPSLRFEIPVNPNANEWFKISKTFVYVKNDYLDRPIYPHIYGATVARKIKLEKGNKATDWTPAPEDVEAKISAEAQKVINLENKTDFLTGTTIEGNAVATGTLLVGNSDGTNAGITGLGNTSDGVYLWGGGTYQQMLQGLAKKEQRRNGIDIWRHPNGQIGFEIGIKDGRLIFNGYHSSGFKLFELDPNRGLVNVSYTQESWTMTPLRKLTYSSSTFNESTIASEIQGFLIKESRETYTTPPPYTPDSDLVYFTIYSVTQNAVGYDYDNGTNPANASYESLKGMKANDNDRNTNVANGWYMSSIGEIYSKSEMSNIPSTYTFTVYVYYYQDGKITQTKVVTVTK